MFLWRCMENNPKNYPCYPVSGALEPTPKDKYSCLPSVLILLWNSEVALL